MLFFFKYSKCMRLARVLPSQVMALNNPRNSVDFTFTHHKHGQYIVQQKRLIVDRCNIWNKCEIMCNDINIVSIISYTIIYDESKISLDQKCISNTIIYDESKISLDQKCMSNTNYLDDIRLRKLLKFSSRSIDDLILTITWSI